VEPWGTGLTGAAPCRKSGTAEREWRMHDLDRCDDPGLLRAYAEKWETADQLWSIWRGIGQPGWK
jgi:hypothetical protein